MKLPSVLFCKAPFITTSINTPYDGICDVFKSSQAPTVAAPCGVHDYAQKEIKGICFVEQLSSVIVECVRWLT
jgi:hypothetical protein